MKDKLKQKIEEFNKLESQLNDPAIVKDAQKLKEVSQQYSELKTIAGFSRELDEIEKNLKATKEIIDNESDEEMIEMAKEELLELEKTEKQTLSKIRENLKPKDPNDKKDIILEIRAGAGGDEASLFVAELFRMYSRYAENKKWKMSILSSSQIGLGGFKEVIAEISGKNVYGTMKYESGVHRVQRIPETEKSGRIHTSTITVAILPKAEEVDFSIDPNDLRIDTFCAGGHGGQSVNTTHSAVRIVHEPTNTVVQCQDERSQLQNREKAMTILRSKLLALEKEKQARELSQDRKSQVGTGDRSEKIRTYNFPQDRITDHRIGESFHSIQYMLEGDLDPMFDKLKEKMQ